VKSELLKAYRALLGLVDQVVDALAEEGDALEAKDPHILDEVRLVKDEPIVRHLQEAGWVKRGKCYRSFSILISDSEKRTFFFSRAMLILRSRRG